MMKENGKKSKVKQLLSDGEWHSTVEIESVSVGGSQGTRRLRELRADGNWIEQRRKAGSTQYEYRLVQEAVSPFTQKGLFE